MTGKKSSVASFAWKTQVGGLQSRSSILIDGDNIYVGTCGNSWNVRDGRDGIHCISLESGVERWFAPTLSDVNEMAIAGTDLIAPTDTGDVFVVNRSNGEIRKIYNADSQVLGRPIVYRMLGGWSAIFSSIEGSIFRIESGGSYITHLGDISGKLRANLAPLGYDAFLAASESGTVFKATIIDGQLTSFPMIELPNTKYGSRPAITASPVLLENKAFFGFARDTYYDAPAVACIDYSKEEMVWLSEGKSKNLGNVRSSPIMCDGLIVAASAYSDSLQLIDPTSGILDSEVLLGQSVFQQWSGPISVGPHHVALGRVDGVCSIVDVRSRRLISSISLATADTEPYAAPHLEDHETDTFSLYPGQPAPAGAICATPAFSNGKLVVGTTDGTLAAIALNLPSAKRYH